MGLYALSRSDASEGGRCLAVAKEQVGQMTSSIPLGTPEPESEKENFIGNSIGRCRVQIEN